MGLKLTAGSLLRPTPWLRSYNSLENPIGIETRAAGEVWRCMTVLQLIRKPDRRLKHSDGWVHGYTNESCYNSLENLIGIETILQQSLPSIDAQGCNSLGNPIGIETLDNVVNIGIGMSKLQLIRKPDRD